VEYENKTMSWTIPLAFKRKKKETAPGARKDLKIITKMFFVCSDG